MKEDEPDSGPIWTPGLIDKMYDKEQRRRERDDSRSVKPSDFADMYPLEVDTN